MPFRINKLLPLDNVPVYALGLAQVPDLRVLVVTQHGGVEGEPHVSPDLVLDPSVRLDQDQARVASLRQHPILGGGWRHRPEKWQGSLHEYVVRGHR